MVFPPKPVFSTIAWDKEVAGPSFKVRNDLLCTIGVGSIKRVKDMS